MVGQAVAETTASGWQMGYGYLHGKLLAEYENSAIYFLQQDHLGSTRVLTALNQGIYDSWDYLPYGETNSGGAGTSHRFTGKERDDETGLDNFGKRYYGSLIGRFITPDLPFADQHAANPQTWNLYTYGRNNPLSGIDPDGRGYLCMECFIDAVHDWWTNGVKRDGGVGKFAKNNGIGAVKGTGSFIVNTFKVGIALSQAAQGNIPAAMSTMMTPSPKALRPSNKTQAQASTAMQTVVLPVATAAIPVGELGSAGTSATRGLSNFGGIFSSEANAAGGTVWTSVGNIAQSDVATIVNSAMYSGGEINILSGVHGLPDGTMTAAPEFFQSDLAAFGDLEDVTVHDITTLTEEQVKGVVNGSGTTIGAFCNSAACLPK